MVVALQIRSCMLSDSVHLKPQISKPHPLLLLSPLQNPGRAAASCWCTRPSVSHPAPISKCLVLLSPCVLCVLHNPCVCVCAMYIAWTLLSAAPLSPPSALSLSLYLSLSATWIYSVFHFAFLVTVRQEHARTARPTPPHLSKLIILIAQSSRCQHLWEKMLSLDCSS